MAVQAIQGFLDELHHYAALPTVPSAEALATASDLRAFLKEVSDHDLGSLPFLLIVPVSSFRRS